MTVAEDSPAQGKPRRVWLAVLVVSVLATGVFGALWFAERGDHKATSDQLTPARAQVQEVKTNLENVRKRNDEAPGKIKTADENRQSYEAKLARDKPCADTGNAIATAPSGPVTQAEIRQLEAQCPQVQGEDE